MGPQPHQVKGDYGKTGNCKDTLLFDCKIEDLFDQDDSNNANMRTGTLSFIFITERK